MTILTVGSTNPNFSFIVSKNPATIQASKVPFKRQVRKGNIYGWFSKKDNSEFRLWFRDSELEVSFGESGEFEYLDKTRYSSPYAPIQMLNEGLRDAVKGVEQDVEGFQAFVETVIEVPSRIFSRIRAPEKCTISFKDVTPASNYQKVKITGPTVSQVLNLLQITCVLATLANDSFYMPLDKAVIFKYLRVLRDANADYYLRHLFLSRAITNSALFDQARESGILDTDTMKFKYGNTQQQRLYAIKDALFANRAQLPDTLVDVGCGELSHAFKLVDKYDTILAYDADEEVCRINQLKLNKREIASITVCNALVDAKFVEENRGVFDGNDVLVSEVLEHMLLQDAFALLKALLGTEAERIVITVPNKDFNQFYGMGPEEVRHPDHKWEPTGMEFGLYMGSAPAAGGVYANWEYRFVKVGDVVNDIPCTFMVVYERKK